MKTANTRICGGFHFPAEKSFAAKYAAWGKQKMQTQPYSDVLCSCQIVDLQRITFASTKMAVICAEYDIAARQ